MKKIWVSLIYSCLLVYITTLLVSCENAGNPGANISKVSLEHNKATEDAGDRILFQGKGEAKTFSIQPVVGGATLLDPAEKEIARFTLDSSYKRFRINSAAGQLLGYAAIKGSAWAIENPEKTKELYTLSRQEDGNYQLNNEAGQAIYNINLREYGFEITTPVKQLGYKVKVEEDKIALVDASEQTYLYTNSALPPLMLACFGFENLSIEKQAALAYAINLSGGR